MVFGARGNRSTDRYEELMARHQALTAEARRLMAEHQRRAVEQLPLAGSSGSVGASTDGIRLSADGALTATIRFHDLHGVESSVILRVDPGGSVSAVHPAETPHEVMEPATPALDLDDRLGVLGGIVREHLPDGAATDFLDLLRPALRLTRAGESDSVVAQLGGLPTLPINSWPVWEEHGPLSHVLSYDCAPVSALLPELGIPSTGRLGFFYFDGMFDNYASIVAAWEPATRPGFRVLHLHPEESTAADITDAATPTPPGLTPFPPVALTAVKIWTWPSWETPIATKVWERHGLTGPRAGVPHDQIDALYEVLWDLPESGSDAHQIGGHPCPQQGPVEMEAEQLRRGVVGQPFDWHNTQVQASASQLQLLLQVASDDDAKMTWGDVGQLYYMAPHPGAPTEALFTWQCG